MTTVESNPDEEHLPDSPQSSRENGSAVRSSIAAQARSWREPVLAATSAAFVGYVILCIVLITGGLVTTHLLRQSLGAWDEHVNMWFSRHRDSVANRVTGDLTLMADSLGITVVAVASAGFMLLRRRVRLAAILVVALATELAAFFTVSYLVGRPRPQVPRVGSTPSTYSWPSGHVAATLVLYGGMAFIVAASTNKPLARIAAGLVAAGLVVCVAMARVYRGDHHPSDTLAGVVLGAGAIWVAVRAIREWRAKMAAGDDSP